jgi:outer membrane protein assembly factor BamA
MFVLFAAPALSDESESQQVIEGMPIGTITIARQNVFDTSKQAEDNWLYRLTNRLHIVTREPVIAKQLLFAEGEPYSQRRIDETQRKVRRNRYLYDASITTTPQSDGSVDIDINTRDIWSLIPELSYTRSGGETKSLYGIEEVNLFGLGQRLVLTRADSVNRESHTLGFSDRQLGQSWVSLALRVADNSDGYSNQLSIEKPFQEFDARWSAGGFAYDDDRRSTLYVLGTETAEYRHERENFRLSGGWSAGLRDNWVTRWTAGIVYDDNRFSAVENPTLPAAIPDNKKFVYPYIGVDILEDRFEKSSNTDQIARSEDFYFGDRIAASLGWADDDFGSDRDALIFTLSGNTSFGSLENKALLLTALIRGRYEGSSIANATAVMNARYYRRQSEKRLFYVSLNATVGENPDLDNPVELGGDTGLRGYPNRYQSGESRVLVTIEQRFFTDWYPFRLFRVGGAAFFDAGRVYGDNPLGGPNLGWLKDVGFGLRLAPTRLGTRKVVHIDIAFPLDGDPTIDNVQILVEAKRSF